MRRSRRWIWLVLGATLVLGGAASAWGFLVEPLRLAPVRLRLPAPGLSAPVRVAVFSDVAFEGEGERERKLAGIVRQFDPHAILVAGDLLNRESEVRDPALLEEARRYLASISPGASVFLVPGEDESPVIDTLREALGDSVDLLVNEPRVVPTPGGEIRLFGADVRTHRIPWIHGRDGERPFVASRSFRFREQQRLVYTGEGSEAWEDVELTAAFWAGHPQAFLDFRLMWREGEDELAGTGWRVTRHEYRRAFKVYSRSSGRDRLRGDLFSGFVPPVRTWCRVRIRVDNDDERSRIRARFWVESDPEPDDWMIDAYDDSPDRNRTGTVAIGGRLEERRYADLRVVDGEGRVLLEEDFADPAETRLRWDSGSSLERFLLEAPEAGAPRIVLAHHPDIVIDVADVVDDGGTRPDLVVAGHTHGGQLRIPGIGALHTDTRIGRRFDRGLFSYRGIPLYVTAGVGTSMIPFRLFSPPEVTLLTFDPAP